MQAQRSNLLLLRRTGVSGILLRRTAAGGGARRGAKRVGGRAELEAPPGAGAIYRYKRGVARLKLGEAKGGEVDLRSAVQMGCGLAKKELRRCQQAEAVANSPPRRPERPEKPETAVAAPKLPRDSSVPPAAAWRGQPAERG